MFHPIRNIFVRLLPFDLGYWIASFFIDSFRREFIATKCRDEYIAKMISKAQYGINAGEENTGWFQSLMPQQVFQAINSETYNRFGFNLSPNEK